MSDRGHLFDLADIHTRVPLYCIHTYCNTLQTQINIFPFYSRSILLFSGFFY